MTVQRTVRLQFETAASATSGVFVTVGSITSSSWPVIWVRGAHPWPHPGRPATSRWTVGEPQRAAEGTAVPCGVVDVVAQFRKRVSAFWKDRTRQDTLGRITPIEFKTLPRTAHAA